MDYSTSSNPEEEGKHPGDIIRVCLLVYTSATSCRLLTSLSPSRTLIFFISHIPPSTYHLVFIQVFFTHPPFSRIIGRVEPMRMGFIRPYRLFALRLEARTALIEPSSLHTPRTYYHSPYSMHRDNTRDGSGQQYVRRS